MDEMRTVHDPYEGRDVQISDRLVDRLRGQYACGPHLPNGRPEFGWRQFQAPPIQHEAADRIDQLEAEIDLLRGGGYVVVPVSRKHAEAMLLVAERYLRDNP